MVKTYLIIFSLISLSINSNVLNVNKEFNVYYNKHNNKQLNVSINLGEITFSSTSYNNNEYIRMHSQGAYHSKERGVPELLQYNQLIEIPYNADIRIEILSLEHSEFDLTELYPNTKIYPAQHSRSKSENNNVIFEYNQSIYKKNDFIEKELIEVLYKGKMREVEIGNLIINPIKYNPQQNKIKIFHNIEFIVHFDNSNIDRGQEIKNVYASPYFETIFKNSLVNYNPVYNNVLSRENDFIEDRVTYVIVTNGTFVEYLDEFIEWKTNKGYDVIVGSTNEIGSSSSAIRAFIQEQYNNPPEGLAPATFVLLVGDTAQLPASYSSGGHVSDLDYCNFSGDDMPELLCGRFSAQTPTHLLTQINKTLEYEQYTMPNPSFLEDVIMISGVDASFAPTYGNGQINYGNQYYFNFTNGINSNTFLYPASGSAESQILNLANQGAAFINYTAHGWESGWADPEFNNTDANNMTNDHKYPTMVGNCCLTNAFDTGTCFGEALLRKNNGGAIGYIGGSDVTYWDEDFWWGVGSGSISANPNYNSSGEGAYDGMFHEGDEENWAIVNSAIILVGNLAVAQANGMDDYYWEIYHLMGDPSLSTYLGVPSSNNVNFNPFLPIGSEAIEIQANPYSYVGLTQNDDLIASGFVDQSGYIVLVFDPINEPGTLDLTITAQNTEPYFDEIFVASPDGAYVMINDVILNAGDDNMISIGETASLDINIENIGSDNAENISFFLTELTGSSFINILDSSYEMEILGEGEFLTISLEFLVSYDSPYGHQFSLNLNMNSSSNDYNEIINLNVESLSESFESNSFDNLNWQNNLGDEPWMIDILNVTDGMYSAKSGSIDHSMSTSLSITIDVIEDGNISFYKAVSCESVGDYTGNYYDYLAFYIDGVEQEKWAGELPWSVSSYPINEGEHTFLWTFIKDHAVTEGQDAAWIDHIVFPPTFNNNISLGDINGDSFINIQDIILTVNMILNSEDYSEVADVNIDGVVDILDVILIVNIILQN